MNIIEGFEPLKSRLFRRGISKGVFETDEREKSVREIIAEVARRGDAALYDFTERFDKVKLNFLEVVKEALRNACDEISPELIEALKLAAERIYSYHAAQKESLLNEKVKNGLGWLVRPLERVGIIVPGQAAPLPSSLMMTVMPAKAAGVKEIILVTPPQKNGKVHPATLAAAEIAGVERVFSVGGAHAIAALAFGTESIPSVDKICGPGNIYVTLAKKLLFGTVGIDGLFGPSEVVIIADEHADPAYAASDVLAQAEHTAGSAIFLTDSPEMADKVNREVEKQLAGLAHAEETRKNLEENGLIGLVESLEQAVELANLYAPEHLLLLADNPEKYFASITAAGCIIAGKKGTVALGDYIAGPSHVLPTGGTARFGSPLNVTDFVKITSLVNTDKFEMDRVARSGKVIAEAEGLDAHARALGKRVDA